MTRFTRSANGKYMVSGKSYDILIGTRAQVWHGTAYKTSGGLTKSHVMQNKSGRIVSKSKHNSAKKENRLVKAGFGTKKGKFGYVKLHKTMSKRKSKRGGAGSMNSSGSSSSSMMKPSSSTNSSTNSNSSSSGSNAAKMALLSQALGSSNSSNTSKSGGAGSSSMMKPSSSSNTNSNSSASSSNAAKAALMSQLSKSGGKSRKRKMKGGMHALNPSSYNGKGEGTSGVNLQFVAGNATS